MAVTQHDIARQAGVSQRTVSRCFGTPDSVAPALRERILRLAEKKGYRPNQAARNMRRGRFENVTLVGDPAGGHAHPRFLAAINERLTTDRYLLTLSDLPAAGAPGRDRLPAAFDRIATDGMIVRFHPEFPPIVERGLAGLKMPTVWINASRASDCVCPDDRRAGCQATKRLIELGHRRIAYLDSSACPASVPSAWRYHNCHERLLGYRAALSEAKVPELLLRPPAGATPAALAAFHRETFAGSRRPTAVLVCCPEDAQTLVYAIGLSTGLRVPRDLSIISFADDPSKTMPSPSAYAVPWADMGAKAADILMNKIGDDAFITSPLLLPLVWHEGHTIAPPPRQ